jgi:hypothetical protein
MQRRVFLARAGAFVCSGLAGEGHHFVSSARGAEGANSEEETIE